MRARKLVTPSLYLTGARGRMKVFLALAMLLCAVLLTPLSLKAQSGRRRPEPSATPNAPRRTALEKPASDNLPGQPATPDAPGTNATTTPAAEQNAAPHPAAANGAVAPNATNETVEVDDGEIVRVSSNLVPVSATVTDARGKAIVDLTVDDFELRVDGQPKPIGGLSQAETPVRLVLLFDNSDSIRASREFEKQAAIRFFKSVLRPAVDQAAIYSVDSVYALEQPLTNDVPELVRTIESFNKPEGATKLFDAMAHAAEYLRLQPGRKVIVLVTDGADTVSDLTYDETLRRIIAADCQVYAVQTGIIENANLYDLMAVRRLEVFSDRTGGAVYIPKNTAALDIAFTQIAADLAQQYILSYYPTDEGRDGRFRTINLRVKTRPSLRVRARRGYYPRRSSSSAQQLSTLPESFVGANHADPASGRSEPPVELDSPLTRPRQIASSPRAVVKFGGPVHGNKNMDAETSGDAPARHETDVRVKPAAKTGELQPTPSDELQPESKSEPVPETKPSPDPDPPPPPPDANPIATPTPTPLASTLSTPPEVMTAAPAENTGTTTATPSSPPPQAPPFVGQLNAKAVKLPKPLYPVAARLMRVEGVVQVEVVVDESGKVISARAVSGPVRLRDEAVAAARRATFAPLQVSNQFIKFAGVISYTFSL
ncbi:MAG: VWA domain-containing protein [Pyrinomonadaceae bacterium]